MGFPFFRIIAIMRFRHYKYYCLFKNQQTRAQIYAMAENHGRLYGAYILNCRIPERIIITTVKITLTDGNNKLDIVPTYYITAGSGNSLAAFTYNYTICLPFLYGHFYSAKYIVEMIEMYKLLGAQQITAYTTKRNLYSDVQKVLHYYEAESILDVIDFELPAVDVWNHAQLVFINDCLYRNIGRAKFVSFQDWDEIIIPARNIDLTSLFQNIFNASIASYQIATMYIHYDPNYPSLINSVQARSERLDKEFTKCVLQPRMVFEQGIHHTSRVIQDHYLTLKLQSSKAVVHHYVKYTDTQTYLVNTISSRYGKMLLRNCDMALKKIFV
uniref:Glycosyltransferase family 92 protein n=2 Tax=Onchocerca TaxID=6281 RepID=A0A8R1XY46_ONCVO